MEQWRKDMNAAIGAARAATDAATQQAAIAQANALNAANNASWSGAQANARATIQGIELVGGGGPAASGGTDPAATSAGGEDPRITAAKIAAAQRQAEIDAENQRRIAATTAAVQGAFEQYGLSSLFPLIQQWAQQGLTEDAIYINLRKTPEYKARFPAMETLASKGRSISEAAYIDYETKAAQMEQMYGLPKGMVTGAVTDLLIGDVSAVELQTRVTLASADAVTAPDDLKQTLQAYYGVDPDEALRGYYLDPERALPILQKQSASARIGVQAMRQGISGIGASLAEEFQGQGVTEADAKKGFGTVAKQAEFTAGRGDTTTNTGMSRGVFGNAEAQKATQRAAEARANRFKGDGGFAADKTGVAALGSASG